MRVLRDEKAKGVRGRVTEDLGRLDCYYLEMRGELRHSSRKKIGQETFEINGCFTCDAVALEALLSVSGPCHPPS